MDCSCHRREWLRSFCSEDSLPFLLLTQVFGAASSSSLSTPSQFPPLCNPDHLLPFCDTIHHHIERFSFPTDITEYREVRAQISFHLQLSIMLARFPELELLVELRLLQNPTNTLYETLLCIWGIEPTSQFLQALQMAVETNEEESLSFRSFLSIRIARILLRQIPCSLPSRRDSSFERTVQFIVYKRLQLGRSRFLQWVVTVPLMLISRVELRRVTMTTFSNCCQISAQNLLIAAVCLHSPNQNLCSQHPFLTLS